MQEVLGYHADLICLQEVDEKAFQNYFEPLMRHSGEGHLPCASAWCHTALYVRYLGTGGTTRTYMLQ